MLKKHSLLPLAALALGLGSASRSDAAVIVTLPTATVTGSIVITQDISFTITAAGGAQTLIFDEWVTNDGAQDAFNGMSGSAIAPALAYSLNGGATQSGGLFNLFDNLATTVTNVTPNDGYLFWNPIAVAVNDVFTVKAATYTLAAGSMPAGFNPGAQQTFAGNVFITDGSGFSLTAPVLVPEPGTVALGALAGLALLRRRRR